MTRFAFDAPTVIRTKRDGGSLSPAMEVVEEIKGMGGEAVADGEKRCLRPLSSRTT